MNKVVIVGAGPSGAAAAIRLAQNGVQDVVLLDKDEWPRDKTCGSGLSPNAIATATELGLGDEIWRLGYPIHAAKIVTPGNREMVLAGPTASSVILLRKYFDNMLVEKARSLGVEFRAGVHSRKLIRDGQRVVGVVNKDGEVRGDYILCADGAHSIFSNDHRPKRTISALMGWWEGVPFDTGTLEMYFDRKLSPLYGWLFPESETLVNIGICMDGEEPDGRKTTRNVRQVFAEFLDDHFRERLAGARQIGKLKGHPISFTTWIRDCTAPGALYLGEAARMTHHVTGEGIYQAMQSGIYAADALADVIHGRTSEERAWRRYTWRCRRRFTASFVSGHALRGVLKTPLLEGVAVSFKNESVRRAATWALSLTLAGSAVSASESARA